MDHKTTESNVSEWVDARVAGLTAPEGWLPNAGRALAQVRSRDREARRRRRAWTWIGVSASTALIVLFALPSTRGIAQQIWLRVFMPRIEVVQLMRKPMPDGMKSLLMPWTIAPQPPQDVAGIDEAARRAGFVPRLPAAAAGGELAKAPRLAVSGPMVGGLRIDVAALNGALREVGVSDLSVPETWNGVEIGEQVSPMVVASYENLALLQMLPPVIVAPVGFPLPHFLEILFRMLRMPAAQARDLGEKFAANPAAFQITIADPSTEVREITLESGTGKLIWKHSQERKLCEACPAIPYLTLHWGVPDRLYTLAGPMTEEQAIGIANSVR